MFDLFLFVLLMFCYGEFFYQVLVLINFGDDLVEVEVFLYGLLCMLVGYGVRLQDCCCCLQGYGYMWLVVEGV